MDCGPKICSFNGLLVESASQASGAAGKITNKDVVPMDAGQGGLAPWKSEPLVLAQ